ncbi:MAG: YetF domain-containing protein [Balneolaceae bacterium]
MDRSWIFTSAGSAAGVILSAIGIYIAVILFTRLSGLRSFSKMSSFDFAMTVAVGSLIANTITTEDPPFFQALIALASLYILQISVAVMRQKSKFLKNMADNQPLLLMDGSEIITENMEKARVTPDDLRAKLREANITQLNQVKAVVMETTGDISVLHHNDRQHQLDKTLMKGVKGTKPPEKP